MTITTCKYGMVRLSHSLLGEENGCAPYTLHRLGYYFENSGDLNMYEQEGGVRDVR